MSNESKVTEVPQRLSDGTYEPVVTKADLRECAVRWLSSNLTYNYATQQAPSVAFAMSKVLRKIYRADDEGYRRSLEYQFKLFNINPQIAGLLLGACIAMEDKGHNDVLDAEQDFKVGLMGSLSGVFDSIIWVLIPTVFGSMAGYMGQQGSTVGMFLWIALLAAIFVWKIFFAWPQGYRLGSTLFVSMADKVAAFTEAASVLGITVIGSLVPSVIKISLGLTYTMGDVTIGIQEGVLDTILVGLLPALATALVYRLVKKGVNMNWIIVGVIAVSCLGAATGILAA